MNGSIVDTLGVNKQNHLVTQQLTFRQNAPFQNAPSHHRTSLQNAPLVSLNPRRVVRRFLRRIIFSSETQQHALITCRLLAAPPRFQAGGKSGSWCKRQQLVVATRSDFPGLKQSPNALKKQKIQNSSIYYFVTVHDWHAREFKKAPKLAGQHLPFGTIPFLPT